MNETTTRADESDCAVCIITGIDGGNFAPESDSPRRDLSLNVLTWGDGSARDYDRDNLDPRLTGAAFNRGEQCFDVPFFDTLREAISHLLSVEKRVSPVQVPATEIEKHLAMPVSR